MSVKIKRLCNLTLIQLIKMDTLTQLHLTIYNSQICVVPSVSYSAHTIFGLSSTFGMNDNVPFTQKMY